MKIKEEIELSALLQYGFKEVSKEIKDDMNSLSRFLYFYPLNKETILQHCYSLVISIDRFIKVYSFDTYGENEEHEVVLDDVLLKMFKDNLFE